MIPILYESTETSFQSNGLGLLGECGACKVTEELNGPYELYIEYPIDGKRFSDITSRRIIYVKPNPYDDPEPFRIYNISKPMLGVVEISAEHISYDLCGTVVETFEAVNAADALTKLKSNESIASSFSYWTDVSSPNSDLSISTPRSARSIVGGETDNILSAYGGELKFNKYVVRLYQHRGYNRGVSIRYGKNLTDLRQDTNVSNVYTGIYPFYIRSDTKVVLPEKVLLAAGTFDFSRILPVDFSNLFGDAVPSVEDLRTIAQAYLDTNEISVPEINLTVSFEQLEKYSEYDTLNLMQQVCLGDTIDVEFEKINVTGTAKAVKTVYDVILDKYESIELGDAKSDLSKSINSLESSIYETSQSLSNKITDTESDLRNAILEATEEITGVDGGYITLRLNSRRS